MNLVCTTDFIFRPSNPTTILFSFRTSHSARQLMNTHNNSNDHTPPTIVHISVHYNTYSAASAA